VPNLPAKAFHFVDAANWPAVQQQGLCSTDGAAAARRLRR